MIKLIIQWEEGNETRQTETELPLDKNWEELQEYIRQLVKKAIKYSDNKSSKGLLKDNELL